MKKKAVCLLSLCLLLLVGSGQADRFDATVSVVNPTVFSAEAEGTVASVSALPGTLIPAGTEILTFRETPVFADRDGTVAILNFSEGDEASGTVLEIEPTEKYTVYFTSDGAYKSPEAQLIHTGETLYLKCTTDGSHRAIGRVTSSVGEEYTVETLGGELFVGETVYAFREEAMPDTSRVGKGTVITAERSALSTEGWIRSLAVQEGDPVWRGQLLYTWTAMKKPALIAEEDLLIAEIQVRPGDSVNKNQTLLTAVTPDQIRVSFTADETQIGKLKIGDPVVITYALENEAVEHRGHIVEILDSSASDSENPSWTVRVLPEDPLLYPGAAAECGTEQE